MCHRLCNCLPLNKQAMDLLSERLAAAEEDTQYLAQQLSLMATNPNSTVESLDTTSQASPPPRVMSPFEAKGLKNPDSLTSRLCKAESAVTTLKLALTTLQNDDDRWRHMTDAEVDNQMLDVKKQHKEEMDKLCDEVVCLQQELLLEREAKARSRSQVQNLQDALMETTQIRADITTKADQLETEKQNLIQNIAKLEKQLVEEQKSRENLEVSHLSLLSRIEQMESIMDCEKNEVQGLTSMYDLLQQETDKFKTKLREEQKQRVKIEKNCQFLLAEKNKLQDLYERSEASNKTLLAETDEQRERHSQLLAQFEQLKNFFEQQQSELKQQAEKTLLEQEITTLKSNLHSLQTEFDESKQELMNARNELENSQRQLRLKEELVVKFEQQMEEGVVVKEQIARLQKEKVLAMNEKEKVKEQGQLLLQETNEHNVQLEKECKRLATELHTIEMTNKDLQEDNEALQQRIANLERKQVGIQQVDEAMKEMVEQKKKLAYEKGNLQSQVQKLEQKISDFKQLTQVNKVLQNKSIQSQKELKLSEQKVKQLEKQLIRQEKENSLKDKNLQEMTQSRDKAINESERLKQDVKNTKNKTQQKILSLQRIAENGKIDNKKLAETLQAVIKSHGRLEYSVEELQMKLGQKDNEIDHLKKDRSTSQTEITNLQKELCSQQQKLMSIATTQTEELGHVRSSLLKSKEENKKMSKSLEEVLDCNISLKDTVNALMAELEKKIKCLKEMKKLREKEEKKSMNEGKLLEGKLDSLREQLHKEREQKSKMTSKEVVEVKRQNDRLLTLNGELSRSNAALRQKSFELERTNKESNEKLQEEKRKAQHLQRKLGESNNQLKAMRNEVEKLHETKQKYLETNNEQLLTIQRFQNQISSLQLEISSLTTLQTSNGFLKGKEDLLVKKGKEGIEDIRLLQELKEENLLQEDETWIKNSQEKLQKFMLQESDQISEKLKEAKQWFVTKFDELHRELLISKKMREDLEDHHYIQQSWLDEKLKAQEAAHRAKAMLKDSLSGLEKLDEFAGQASNQAK